MSQRHAREALPLPSWSERSCCIDARCAACRTPYTSLHTSPWLQRLFVTSRLLWIRREMTLNQCARARLARNAPTRTSLKLKCTTNKFSYTTAMRFNLRRIACPMEPFHPICCSTAPVARVQKAATSSTRSITSRVKSRRFCIRHAGHATGSIHAVDPRMRNRCWSGWCGRFDSRSSRLLFSDRYTATQR